MRTNLEHSNLTRPRLTGLSNSNVVTTLTGTFVIPSDGPGVHVLDGGLSNRTVRLPLKSFENQIVIANSGATNLLNVTDSSGASQVSLPPQSCAIFYGTPNRWIWVFAPFTISATTSQEYFSIAELAAATLTVIDARVQLNFPHGSMILKRQVGAPAHLAYARSADGAYYVYESGVLVPELVGMSSAVGFDNTIAFGNFAAAINILKPKAIRFERNAVYEILQIDAGIIVASLADYDDWTLDLNGATIQAKAPTCIPTPAFMLIERCKRFSISGGKFLQDKAVATPNTLAGLNGVAWITLKDACEDFKIDVNINGGKSGVAVFREYGSATGAVKRGTITGYMKNVFYPAPLEGTGWKMHIDIETYNAGRSFLGHGFDQVDLRIRSTPSGVVEDISISAHGFAPTQAADNIISRGLNLHYTSHNQLGLGGMIAIQNQPEGVNHWSQLRDIHIDLDVRLDVGFTTLVTVNNFKLDGGGATVVGDLPDQMIQATITGSVFGDPTSALAVVGQNSTGAVTAGGCLVDAAFRDLFAPSNTHVLFAGKLCNVVCDNVHMPSGSIQQEAAADPKLLTIIHSESVEHAGRYSRISQLF